MSDTFFNKRSIGFGFPVTDNDTSLFDPNDYGIKLSGLKGVTEDLGISQEMDGPCETNQKAELGGFILHSGRSCESRLLANDRSFRDLDGCFTLGSSPRAWLA